MELTKFVGARLDEWAADPEWHAPDCGALFSDYQDCDCRGAARVLAQVEAMRRIVAAYEKCGGPTDADRERLARDHPRAAQYAAPEWYEGQTYGLAEAVQNLAALYADHPDYEPQWVP